MRSTPMSANLTSKKRTSSGEPDPAWRWDLLALPGILILALALRLWRLGDANLWWDEALAIWAVRKGFVGVTLWTASDVHPPLYFWTLWAWVRAFGESPFAMRSISALWGTLTVFVSYHIGYRAALPQSNARRVGFLAGFLVATSRFHIWWSQEMRMYALAGLLGMLALYCLLRWLEVPESRRWLLFCTLASIGAMYTIFISGAFLLAQNALVLVALLWGQRKRRPRILWPWVISQLCVMLVVAVWMAFSWNRMPSWSTAEPVSVRFLAQMVATLLTTGISVDIGRIWPIIVAVCACDAVALVFLVRTVVTGRERSSNLALLGLALTLILSAGMIYLATQPRSLFYTPSVEARYFLPYAPAFWILLAWGLVALMQRWRVLGRVMTGIVVVVWLGVLPGYYQGRCMRDDMQSLTRAIVRQAEPGDAVLLDSGGRYPIFLYAYERLKPESYHPPLEVVSFSEDKLTREKVEATLDELTERYERVWLAEVDVHQTDPDRLVRQGLAVRRQEAWSEGFGHNALLLYSADGAAPRLSDDYVPDVALDKHFAGGHLRGYDMPLERVAAGDALRVALLWDEPPKERVAAELHHEDGTPIRLVGLSAVDGSEARRQSLVIPIDRDLSDGRYDIVLQAGPSIAADSQLLGQVKVACSSRWPKDYRVSSQLQANLGDVVILSQYGMRGAVSPDREVVLDLEWRAIASADADYTVFVQLVGTAYNPDTQGPVWAQSDAEPGSGSAHTSQWLEGDRLIDRHILQVDPDAPEGSYQIIAGMYDPATGERLSVASPGGEVSDHVVLWSGEIN